MGDWVTVTVNEKPVLFKIDTGADVTAIKETSKSLHGPAKQVPANNVWTIHWHADISTIKHVSRDFRSSIVTTRESVSVDKEHSKQYGGQASVDSYKRWYTIVLNVAENATNIQSLYEHGTIKLTLEEVATDLFYGKASTYLLIVDYYSRYIEISKLNGQSSSEIISHKINLC